jgi:hypothetical protein
MVGYGALRDPRLFGANESGATLEVVVREYVELARQHRCRLIDVKRHIGWFRFNGLRCFISFAVLHVYTCVYEIFRLVNEKFVRNKATQVSTLQRRNSRRHSNCFVDTQSTNRFEIVSDI